MTHDNQMISARINLWIENDEVLAENTVFFLRGQKSLNQFNIASEIRDDLLYRLDGSAVLAAHQGAIAPLVHGSRHRC